MKRILALLVIPISASAYCPAYPDVPNEFRGNEFVFVGKVTSEEKVHASGDFFDGINYTLQVTEQFKGMPKKSFVVFSENSSGRFPMEQGVSYLVFASLQSGLLADGPAFAVSYCGNSGPVAEKESSIVQVRQLAKHAAQPAVQRDGPASGGPAR